MNLSHRDNKIIYVNNTGNYLWNMVEKLQTKMTPAYFMMSLGRIQVTPRLMGWMFFHRLLVSVLQLVAW